MPQHSSNQGDVGPVARPAVPATEPFGLWTYRIDDGILSWTDTLFGFFGFAVNEVVPTFSLMSSHQHPQDRMSWDQEIQTILTAGNTVSVWHRIVDTRMRHRTLHTVLSATADDAGEIVRVSGLMTDLTRRLQQERAQAATEAVTRSAQSRGVIDQAKGIIMATMNLEEQAAFDLLRWHSSHMNLKLRDVAAAVVAQRAELTAPESVLPPRERLTATITGLADARVPMLSAARSVSDPAVDIDTDQETARTGRISSASLPRTMIRAVAAAAQSISIVDYNALDQPLVYVNRAFEALTGYQAEELLGRNCRSLQGGPGATAESEAAALALLRGAITAGEEIRTVLRNYRRDGTAFWNELHCSAVRDPTGRITHYVGYQTDVSERVEREQQLEHLAFHDARTNLPNQAAAAAHLALLLASGEGIADLAVARVHLSGFRAANGFDDPLLTRTVLATVARRLQATLGPPTYLAKLEEDTFLVVLTDRSLLDAAAAVLAEPIALTNGEVRLRVRVEMIATAEVKTLAQSSARP